MNPIELVVFCVGIGVISACLGALAVKLGCKLGRYIAERTK